MKELEYTTKEGIKDIASEVLEFLRTKNLAIWQAKEVLNIAAGLMDWEKLK